MATNWNICQQIWLLAANRLVFRKVNNYKSALDKIIEGPSYIYRYMVRPSFSEYSSYMVAAHYVAVK